ncbi:hypothetical protein PCANB_000495 [Pneumocystis canis]|nr:hypothetical protein PCK1_000476 [Pneumocystis canis]KAG5437782.1 hypothetical protein PCANB_000495 [Pneumocystis canis]
MKLILQHSRTPVVFISTSYSPFVNLSFEDYLFCNHVSTAVLLLYRNDTSVIIGRNQNPWMEVDLKYMKEQKISLARRRSGGGTVFHDFGNTNYCFMTSRACFNRKTTLQMVIDALYLAGKLVCMNERYDLVFGSNALKVSGSAFRISKDRAYHHGTMLLNTNLTSLRNLLKNQNQAMNAKGVQSVFSAVGNLEFDHEDFCRHLCFVFQERYNLGKSVPIHYVSEEEICAIDEIQKRIFEMKQWSWIYGQTPEFTNHLIHTFSWGYVSVHIVCKHGLFSHIQIESNTKWSSFFQEICHGLIGRRYVTDEIQFLLYNSKALPGVKEELIQFLEWFAMSI